jgi:hypothetical protein
MRLPIFCLLVISRLVWADPSLDAALDAVAPNLGKWGTVCQVKEEVGKTVFEWHDYRDTGRKTDFWPASTIKLPAAIAAIELLNKQRIDLDAELTFQHQDKDGRWITDVGRTPREMISEVFRRSSNEDYTLLLRLTGIDWLHEHFFTAERGFPRGLGPTFGRSRSVWSTRASRSLINGRAGFMPPKGAARSSTPRRAT